MLRFLVIAAFISFSGSLQAQEVFSPSPSALKKIKKVEEALTNLEWTQAKDLSEKLVKQYPEWPAAWKIYAGVYHETGDIKTSEKALRQLVMLDSTGFPEAYRWIAEWTFNRGGYDEASINFGKYMGLIRDTSGLPYQTRLLRSSILFALKEISNPTARVPEKLDWPVNTDDDEYFPSLSVDGSVLVFTRQSISFVNPETSKPQEDLYYTTWQDTCYRMPEPFPFPINTTGNEGTQSLRQDGRIMFFTACNRSDSKGGCDIYYCIKTGNEWSVPVNPGPPINTRYWESTPYLAPDGKRLFFASNRPGGSGGMDIWQVLLKPDKSWSAARNLGPSVNTVLDEMSPILLVDGKTLFFASNGHIGMGGFDLFKTDLSKTGNFYLPENLGYNINTCFDEDGLTINANLNAGMFTSNRDTVTGKDLYLVEMNSYIPVSKTLTLSGSVRDRISGLPVGARIEIQPHGDTLISSVESDPVSGSFLLGIPKREAYRIGASGSGYLPYSDYFRYDTLEKENKILYSIELEPVKAGAVIVLRNIFFEFNSYELLPESDKDLNEILDLFHRNSGIIVEISGHTDSVGSDAFNLDLSRKRAESVMKYLIDHGINSQQLKAVGYGRSQPVATNDTEEGRSLNRRTGIRVIRMK